MNELSAMALADALVLCRVLLASTSHACPPSDLACMLDQNGYSYAILKARRVSARGAGVASPTDSWLVLDVD
jgi:hypothetical protein